MMAFTHILVGILLSAGISQLAGLSVTPFMIAGAVGGLFPDIDLLFTHRKTFHYPFIFPILTIISVAIYAVVQLETLLFLTAFMAAAAAHSAMDVLGGGKEMRPWRETDDRAVYDHLRQRWVKPLRLFYDGSLPDLILAIISAVGILYAVSSGADVIISLLVVLAIIYTLLRRVVTQWIPEDYATFSSYIQHKIR